MKITRVRLLNILTGPEGTIFSEDPTMVTLVESVEVGGSGGRPEVGPTWDRPEKGFDRVTEVFHLKNAKKGNGQSLEFMALHYLMFGTSRHWLLL
jgi:hypothetical protein